MEPHNAESDDVGEPVDHETLLNDDYQKLLDAAPFCYFETFETISNYISSRSATAKLFRNEYHERHPNKAKDKKGKHAFSTPLCKSAEQKKKYFEPYYVALPRSQSHFTRKEMSNLFAVCLASQQGSKSVPTVEQLKTYTASLEMIKYENNDYLQLVKKRWLEESWSRNGTIKHEIIEFISSWWQERIRRVKMYPQLYVQVTSISLSPPDDAGVKLNFVKQLKSLGHAPRYFVNANPHTTIKLPYDASELERLLACYTKNEVNSEPKEDDEVFKEVSEDNHAKNLAIESLAQVVTTPSAIATILAHDPITFAGNWCIPFCVREFKIDDHPRKIIFMDKKLAPKSLSAVKKNQLFAKMAIRQLFKKARLKKGSCEQTFKGDGDDSSSNSETEGDEDEFPSVLLEKLLSHAKGGALHSRLVNYNLWECSSSEDTSVLSKHHKKPYKLLIRTSVKGYNINRFRKNNPCILLPKLEYQPEYGAEVCSFEEIAGEWIKVLLCPDSFLHRVRVDPMRGSTVMIEEKSATELSNDCQRIHGRNLHTQWSVLHNLIEKLSTLPCGRYVLKHDDNNGGFVSVCQEQDVGKKITLNLHEMYEGLDTTATASQAAPWIPLDTTILTPSFKYSHRMPCTFPPCRDDRFKPALPQTKNKAKPKKKHKTKKTKKNKSKAEQKKASPAKPSDEELMSYDDFMETIEPTADK